MRKWGFLIIGFGLNLLVQTAEARCLIDYKESTNKIQHHYSFSDMALLKKLAAENNPILGWKKLGELGDEYAQIAYQVLDLKTQSNNTMANRFYHNLIKTHWINVAGTKKYQENFYQVASQHFRQYIEILKLGYNPDSDQILLSYLTATKKYNLPELIVFDAAWVLSGYDKIKTWQELNHLTPDRIVYESRVCLHSSSAYASMIILDDLTTSSLATLLAL